jgi:MinD superfamily P-loop ATPase
MKEITVLSGKGGTGKTSVAAALASVGKNLVFSDNDVDAPDLHLILHPEIREDYPFQGGRLVTIDPSRCSSCGICMDYCRFDAIHINTSDGYYINDFQCEGCRLCERVCPENAIHSEENWNNRWFISDTRFGKMVHGKMSPGEENTGKLVTRIRKKAMEIALETGADYILNDGPPGIGCPAIASVTGANVVLIITEPTMSGLHDLIRLTEMVGSFNVPVYAVINKYDINREVENEIEKWLSNHHVPLLAKIPFREDVIKAVIAGQSIVEYDPGSEISDLIRKIWGDLTAQI